MINITVSDHADQQFAVILNNRRVTLRLRYNPIVDRWTFDLSIDDVPKIQGRKIVTGVDLLKPFNLGIGILFAWSIVPGSVPNREQLINGSVGLFHTMPEEVHAAISA